MKKIKLVPLSLIILAVIIVVGIFLVIHKNNKGGEKERLAIEQKYNHRIDSIKSIKATFTFYEEEKIEDGIFGPLTEAEAN